MPKLKLLPKLLDWKTAGLKTKPIVIVPVSIVSWPETKDISFGYRLHRIQCETLLIPLQFRPAENWTESTCFVVDNGAADTGTEMFCVGQYSGSAELWTATIIWWRTESNDLRFQLTYNQFFPILCQLQPIIHVLIQASALLLSIIKQVLSVSISVRPNANLLGVVSTWFWGSRCPKPIFVLSVQLMMLTGTTTISIILGPAVFQFNTWDNELSFGMNQLNH